MLRPQTVGDRGSRRLEGTWPHRLPHGAAPLRGRSARRRRPTLHVFAEGCNSGTPLNMTQRASVQVRGGAARLPPRATQRVSDRNSGAATRLGRYTKTTRRLHDARHGTATLLTAAGVAPRVVMQVLGHSQIAVPMNVYAHVVQDTQRKAVSHMDRLLRSRPRA
ncbi:tyrosine-type recombinase/integrase [Streptomyces sp. NPDC046316]|uniref:tyrosine-type recombinase/integrase n=1 Tax=Streptomyces sp. NPDC046316 TaxID=3154494 RepID=UPI0033E11649